MEAKLSRFKSARPKPINVSTQNLTRSWVMSEAEGLPLVIEPAADQLELAKWAASRRDELKERLLRYGAILFRGFKVGGVEQFQAFARTISPGLLDEIRLVYLQSAVRFDWQENDVMMLDNFLTSHGRESFVGPRQILVASV